jgi:YfiH family protein
MLTPSIQCYFGTAQDNLFPDYYTMLPITQNVLTVPSFAHLQDKLSISNLFFLRQVHGTDGLLIQASVSLASFTISGDYLITSTPGVGIGVMTADCLPVIVLDTKSNAIGIAHAGWRGAVAGVCNSMVHHMQQAFDTQIQDIVVYFGPSAQACCYQVGPEVITAVQQFSWAQRVLQNTDKGIYFNVPLFVQLHMQQLGIQNTAFIYEYARCTLHNHEYFSYRRQGANTGRQMTVVGISKHSCT